MDYDFIATDRAVNETAAKVLQTGEHYESIKRINQVRSEVPLPIKQYEGLKEYDVTGKKIGRLTVIGYYGTNGRGALWVVRCSCGAYETRKYKAITNPNNSKDACQECLQIEYLKRHSAYKDGMIR